VRTGLPLSGSKSLVLALQHMMLPGDPDVESFTRRHRLRPDQNEPGIGFMRANMLLEECGDGFDVVVQIDDDLAGGFSCSMIPGRRRAGVPLCKQLDMKGP